MNLKAYGKTLVNEEPDETTELLKKLCSDYRPVVDKPPDRMFFLIAVSSNNKQDYSTRCVKNTDVSFIFLVTMQLTDFILLTFFNVPS